MEKPVATDPAGTNKVLETAVIMQSKRNSMLSSDCSVTIRILIVNCISAFRME
jgi:hypothetical protein